MGDNSKTVTVFGAVVRLLEKLASRHIAVSVHKAGVAALRIGVRTAIEDPHMFDQELASMELERRGART